MNPLPYGRHDISEEDIAAVVACLRSDRLTQGPRVAAFEEALREATGAKYAIAVSNGTAALHIGALSLGLSKGDVGITSAITFVASANAIRYAGADVELVDVDPATGLMDIDDLSKEVARLESEGRPPKLIVPVDLAGQPADLPAIRAIADACGARVLEDAAHSFGATHTHQGAVHRVGDGRFAQGTTLSFHPVKHITTGEGGALLTNDDAVADTARRLRTHGISYDLAARAKDHDGPDDPFSGPWLYEQELLGFNYRLTDIQCALGLSQMTRFPAFLARRRSLAARYDGAFAEESFAGLLRPLRKEAGRSGAYHLYVVQVVAGKGEPLASVAARRKRLYLFLKERGILAQIHYIPVSRQPFHRATGERPLPGALAYYAASLSLPLFPAMEDADLERVLMALGDWAAIERAATTRPS